MTTNEARLSIDRIRREKLEKDSADLRALLKILAEESEWPTAPASFVSDRYGVVFYHGLPNFHYTIIGRYDRPNLPLDELAISAQMHGVNAVCLSVESLMALHQDKSTATVVATGDYARAVNQPGDIYLAPHTSTFAYLIKPINPADFAPPTSSEFELTNVDTVASPRRSRD